MTRRFADVSEFVAEEGKDLGQSPWMEITQERVNLFADATDDHQWIHTDPNRAERGPFGTTVAHGYLTLALVAPLLSQIYEVGNLRMGLNYGAERVRFPSVLKVGSRVRADAHLLRCSQTATGWQVVLRVTFRTDGQDKPVCVADVVQVLVPRKPRTT